MNWLEQHASLKSPSWLCNYARSITPPLMCCVILENCRTVRQPPLAASWLVEAARQQCRCRPWVRRLGRPATRLRRTKVGLACVLPSRSCHVLFQTCAVAASDLVLIKSGCSESSNARCPASHSANSACASPMFEVPPTSIKASPRLTRVRSVAGWRAPTTLACVAAVRRSSSTAASLSAMGPPPWPTSNAPKKHTEQRIRSNAQ